MTTEQVVTEKDMTVTTEQFSPSAGILVVEYEEISETTRRGIIKGRTLLEEQQKELSKMFHTVVKVGENCGDIQVGDRVLPARPVMEMPLKASEGKKTAWVRVIDLVGVVKA